MKNSDYVKQIEDILSNGNIELVSYGLAPNPFGFCFEVLTNSGKKEAKKLSGLLDCLNEKEENYLRAKYF